MRDLAWLFAMALAHPQIGIPVFVYFGISNDVLCMYSM